MDRILVHALGNTENIERQLWLSAHGIHVAQRICRRNLPEKKGIIHNGREEVRGLHQGRIFIDDIYAGVVALIIAHDEPRVCVGLKPG